MEIFAHLNHWHWWGLAVALVILETLVPGTFFLWPALAAVVVGLLVLAAPAVGWEYQVLLFALLSVASVVFWRRYTKDQPRSESDHPNLNRRGRQYIGRSFDLTEPIVNGHGRVRVDDTVWRVEGPDLPAGSKVKVVGVDGVVLKVEEVRVARAE